MNATEFTEKGKGATLADLFTVVCAQSIRPGDENPIERAGDHLDRIAVDALSGADRDAFLRSAFVHQTGLPEKSAGLRTNVKLNPGRPLTVADLDRIARAEV